MPAAPPQNARTAAAGHTAQRYTRECWWLHTLIHRVNSSIIKNAHCVSVVITIAHLLEKRKRQPGPCVLVGFPSQVSAASCIPLPASRNGGKTDGRDAPRTTADGQDWR